VSVDPRDVSSNSGAKELSEFEAMERERSSRFSWMQLARWRCAKERRAVYGSPPDWLEGRTLP
jgi:hypothetical protein